MPKMMFRKRFEGMGLFGVPPTPTYSFSIFAFIASLTSPGLRSLGTTGSGTSGSGSVSSVEPARIASSALTVFSEFDSDDALQVVVRCPCWTAPKRTAPRRES
jgi:hypothetical protein